MDFVAGFVYSPVVFLTKRPDVTTNLASVVNPFQSLVRFLLTIYTSKIILLNLKLISNFYWKVWFLLIVSLLVVTTALYVFNRHNLVKLRKKLDPPYKIETKDLTLKRDSEVQEIPRNIPTTVFGNILNQGKLFILLYENFVIRSSGKK